MKRFLVLFMCAAILICSGCNSKNDDNSESIPTSTTASPDDTGNTEAGSVAVVTDDVPEYDFKEAEFIIASVDNTNFSNIYVTHEDSGELLNDAVYKRTAYIEDRFNVKLTEFFVADGDVPSRFKKEVNSGDAAFHIFNMRCDHALPLWISGSTVMWDEIPNIDLQKEYWDQSINSFLTINNTQAMSI